MEQLEFSTNCGNTLAKIEIKNGRKITYFVFPKRVGKVENLIFYLKIPVIRKGKIPPKISTKVKWIFPGYI